MRSGSVVIVSDYIGGEGAASGGAGHAALDSYHALRAAGVDVRMIAGFGDVPTGTEDRFRSLGGRDLRAGGAFDTLGAIYNRDARHALASELAHEDTDTTVVILHQWTRYLSPAALGLLDRFPAMIYMHDYFWPCPNGAYYDFRQARPCDRQPLGARCIVADCDRQGRVHKLGRLARQTARVLSVRAPAERRLFLHLSAGARRTVEPLLPGERHATIHNVLVLPPLAPAPTQSARFDVGYFGRLEPEKGVGILAEAADRLNLTGLFVGDGALAETIACHPGLEHRRWAPRVEMAALMRLCSVVVLPSLWPETWGLIVPEAMAAGVKVLVSARAGSSELVTRFGGGLTFDPGVPTDLDARLIDLLAMPVPISDWAGLRRALSPGFHAERLVALAAQRFGIDVRAYDYDLTEAAASAQPTSPPAEGPPLPR